MNSTFSIGALGALPLLLFFAFLIFSLVATVFWIWALVDCASKEPSQGNDKVVWILVIVFTHWIGALLYLLVRRPRRISEYGK